MATSTRAANGQAAAAAAQREENGRLIAASGLPLPASAPSLRLVVSHPHSDTRRDRFSEIHRPAVRSHSTRPSVMALALRAPPVRFGSLSPLVGVAVAHRAVRRRAAANTRGADGAHQPRALCSCDSRGGHCAAGQLPRRASQPVPQRNVWARRHATIVLIVTARFRLSRGARFDCTSGMRGSPWAKGAAPRGRQPVPRPSHDQRRVRAIGFRRLPTAAI